MGNINLLLCVLCAQATEDVLADDEKFDCNVISDDNFIAILSTSEDEYDLVCNGFVTPSNETFYGHRLNKICILQNKGTLTLRGDLLRCWSARMGLEK